ncbi:hypothetical protein [Streptomyces subrutilus]|uniref:Uncharacterized protein n=1 Tax=Streptomyces subrutilus TaxID=36818 RepID=A0A1E5PYY2_9ACTN|nr:hypothetical protein BGK67_28090 [Streptomyces subrutilus]
MAGSLSRHPPPGQRNFAGSTQDRLWQLDLFRHVGRGDLTPFTGSRRRKITDLIALASVVGGLFGGRGGGGVQAALSLLSAQQKHGPEEGTRVWESFRPRTAEAAGRDDQGPPSRTDSGAAGRGARGLGSVGRGAREAWCARVRGRR